MTSNSATKTTTKTEGRNLILERIIDAPREKVYQAWTDPTLLKQWFAPKPWAITDVNSDIRAGGASRLVMRGPDGQEMPLHGLYLEVVPNEKVVFTDAFTGAWELSDRPFMTVVVTFDDTGDGRTRYKAVAKHWNDATREEHEKMGFHQGWAQCAEQLAELVEH